MGKEVVVGGGRGKVYDFSPLPILGWLHAWDHLHNRTPFARSAMDQPSGVLHPSLNVAIVAKRERERERERGREGGGGGGGGGGRKEMPHHHHNTNSRVRHYCEITYK